MHKSAETTASLSVKPQTVRTLEIKVHERAGLPFWVVIAQFDAAVRLIVYGG